MTTEASRDQAATAMESTVSMRTFHLFTNLPTELRYKIWRHACLPFTKAKAGFSYIDLDVVENDWGKCSEFHYRDEGLWRACKESRDVIALHYQLHIWRKSQGNRIDWTKECRDYLIHQRNQEPEIPNSSDKAFFTVVFGPFSCYYTRSVYYKIPTCSGIRVKAATQMMDRGV
ncbi:hypothetical protein FLONG3_7795 [Fusarium longipes]|uniref:2EXR domain-containing protein n=1 Tax=Fusarium longipes TaxID=694270 RepID=A0A395SBD9_9HYPO|nr:hypothetical protein FLONG3_7795 [Fusarium longipes]